MAVRGVLVVGAVLDPRGGDGGGAPGGHGEHEQRKQYGVQHGQDRGSGRELAERGHQRLGVGDQALGRLRAPPGGL